MFKSNKIKMENSNIIERIIYDDILEQFFMTKEKFKQKNLSLNDFIDDKASNPEFPNIISYKTAVDRRAKDICGFYDLFYTLNYIKYMINERDIYYLYKNTNKKSFFKFYKNFLPFFIQNMPSLEDYEIKELNNESSLERHHLDYILKNKLLFKYMGKNYDEITKKFQCEFEWFDFMGNNFAISEIEKIKKIDDIFKEIFKINNEENPTKKIFFLYIGLTEHWILIIYDFKFKNSFIKLDSFYAAQDLINLKYLDQKEIEIFMDKVNKDYEQINQKKISKYAINLFYNSIIDTHRVLYKLNNFISSTSKEYINLGISILEEKCSFLLQSFEKLKINHDDNLNKILIIYEWFSKEYHPKTIKEEYYDLMKALGITNKDCTNETINKFFEQIKNINTFLKDNLKLIEQKDIKEFLEKGYDIINQIIDL